MKVEQAVATYVAYKQSLGMRFSTEARTLKSFSKSVGNVDLDRIGSRQVRIFLDGNGPMTRFWHRKFDALRGFYRFCLARGYCHHVPLPAAGAKCPQSFTPYIYSEDEIKRLLEAAAGRVRCNICAPTSQTLLLLLYASGLRISEALNLDMADVDLEERLLHIRETKFYKTRLVPTGTDLTQVLREYALLRCKRSPIGPDAPFLLTRRGKRPSRAGAEEAFKQIRKQAGVRRVDGARYQPRLHDLRHAFAQTRLVRWYREGADVQRLLPQLATYLGHVHIAGTQRYLTLTPELLQQASLRFERFAFGVGVPIMRETTSLGPWIRRFLLEHLTSERNLAVNTRRSYRDTICQLLPFVSARLRKAVDRLAVVDMSSKLVREFLSDVEGSRGCGIATRNQRLAAIHALARFIGEHSPEHIAWSAQVRCVPYKKGTHATVPYLDKAEIDALLACPDRRTPQGLREYALLLFLYNTGARASEASELTISDLHLDHASVNILGKGRKRRQCPLWPATVSELRALVADRSPQEPVFLNRCGQPVTRFGVHALVERTAAKVQTTMPTLADKRVSPHSIRHSTATHMLSAGVDINTVRAWLGHASLETTNVYAEIDLEGKARALAKCEVTGRPTPAKRWRADADVMQFLRSL